jgi:hypothetical protein
MLVDVLIRELTDRPHSDPLLEDYAGVLRGVVESPDYVGGDGDP